MHAIKLLPPEATQITMTMPSGKELVVDALDIDDMVAQSLVDGKFSYDTFHDIFFQKYEERISQISATALLNLKHEVLESVKKNSLGLQDPTGTTNQDQSDNETSSSSDS